MGGFVFVSKVPVKLLRDRSTSRILGNLGHPGLVQVPAMVPHMSVSLRRRRHLKCVQSQVLALVLNVISPSRAQGLNKFSPLSFVSMFLRTLYVPRLGAFLAMTIPLERRFPLGMSQFTGWSLFC